MNSCVSDSVDISLECRFLKLSKDKCQFMGDMAQGHVCQSRKFRNRLVCFRSVVIVTNVERHRSVERTIEYHRLSTSVFCATEVKDHDLPPEKASLLSLKKRYAGIISVFVYSK
ncbi:hypothetical protein TMatcc_003048 [Talaromyces marneffei ATCC 18224]